MTLTLTIMRTRAQSALLLAGLAEVCVCLVVFVALVATLLVELSNNANAAPQIFASRDRIQVLRIDATPNPAFVIQVHALWNWPDEHRVGNAVGPFAAIQIKDTVSSVAYGRNPKPATAIGFRGHILHESFECGKTMFGHVTPFSRIGRGRCGVEASHGPQAILPQWGMA